MTSKEYNIFAVIFILSCLFYWLFIGWIWTQDLRGSSGRIDNINAVSGNVGLQKIPEQENLPIIQGNSKAML